MYEFIPSRVLVKHDINLYFSNINLLLKWIQMFEKHLPKKTSQLYLLYDILLQYLPTYLRPSSTLYTIQYCVLYLQYLFILQKANQAYTKETNLNCIIQRKLRNYNKKFQLHPGKQGELCDFTKPYETGHIYTIQ